jgi:hypothetical protein
MQPSPSYALRQPDIVGLVPSFFLLFLRTSRTGFTALMKSHPLPFETYLMDRIRSPDPSENTLLTLLEPLYDH